MILILILIVIRIVILFLNLIQIVILNLIINHSKNTILQNLFKIQFLMMRFMSQEQRNLIILYHSRKIVKIARIFLLWMMMLLILIRLN